ncbi:hypothetical protein GCM10010421_11320 [Streptomyces glaucus]|uniref:Membrane transport protein MMPL domain-containing protein n=1 Tax=Streptomyces glaucus TaxID=284029 RepID=A0ABN3JCU9_9ACTN
MGAGLAAAVLIDATVVRGVLLPAVTALLGERDRCLPRWLRRLPDPTHDEAPEAVTRTARDEGAPAGVRRPPERGPAPRALRGAGPHPCAGAVGPGSRAGRCAPAAPAPVVTRGPPLRAARPR